MSDKVPKDNTVFTTKEYWVERYAEEAAEGITFDWFKKWADLKEVLGDVVARDHRILNAGCGNSTLPLDMHRDGYTRVVNVDYAPACIEQMAAMAADAGMPELEFAVGDCRALEYEDASFDCVIDKGTIDAVMAEKGDVWDPAPEMVERVEEFVREYHRVLRPGGTCIYITFGQPHFRKRYFELDEFDWSLKLHTLGDAFHYFVYVYTRKG